MPKREISGYPHILRFFQKGADTLIPSSKGIDILFFEPDADPHFLQRPDIAQTVQCISGEPGDGFRQNEVDLLLTALSDHPVEAFALLCRGS